MLKPSADASPKLAPPGAGIPFPQRLVLRFVVNPFFTGREPIEKSRKRFFRLHEKIREEFVAIPENQRDRKVLVPPQRGLEDSSRFWSAAMVLEHVEIVGRTIGEVIVALTNDVEPGAKADTAAVKPHGSRSPAETLISFERFRAEGLNSIESRARNWASNRTFDHPWFGPLTARKWYWLLGIHAGIHFEQIRAIRGK